MPDIGRACSKKATEYILGLARERAVVLGHKGEVTGTWDAEGIRVFWIFLWADGYWSKFPVDVRELALNPREKHIECIIDPRLTGAMMDMKGAGRKDA